MGLLSLAIWTPIAFGLVLLAFGRDDQAYATRWISLVGALVSFLITLPIYAQFDNASAAMQFAENLPWIERFNVNYHLGVDGISLWFVVLTAFINLVVVIASWESITVKVQQYMAAFLILSGLMIGVFCALDGMLFYVFFEATLIPMYLIIGIWGGPNKIYAAFKFFLYTLLGSLLTLVALIYLYIQTAGSFDIATWHALPLSASEQSFLFFAFLAAFAVKVPMWPVHTWLPDAHVQAPTAGSVILAGVLLKMGGYGFIRFSLPMFPEASATFAPLVWGLSMAAVVLTSLYDGMSGALLAYT
jgi:NADH-quinone oxidoreductase subunit M